MFFFQCFERAQKKCTHIKQTIHVLDYVILPLTNMEAHTSHPQYLVLATQHSHIALFTDCVAFHFGRIKLKTHKRLHSPVCFLFLCWEQIVRFFLFWQKKKRKTNSGLVPLLSVLFFFFYERAKSMCANITYIQEKHRNGMPRP